MSSIDLANKIEQKGEDKSHHGTENVNQFSCSFLRNFAVSGSNVYVPPCKTRIWNEKQWTRARLQRPQHQDFYGFSDIKY